jgi:predicted porin
MKKITLAAVMAFVTLGASAQVALTGKVSQWMDNTKTGAASVQGMATEPTSNIAFTITEDLGGGLKARGVVETSLSGNSITGTGTQIGDRQSTVGLASKFGSIDLGRNVHSQFLAIANNDPFNTLYGSVAGDVHNLRGLRFSNGAFVATNFGPVNATWDRSNNVPGTADATAYSLGASIAGVSANYAVYQQGAAEKSTVVGLGAKAGAANVFYSHSDNKSATAGETKKGDLIGASQRIGAITAKASYGKTNTEVKAYNVGFDYHLSKRTEVGVAYRNVDLVGSAHDVKQIGVGLTHRF